MVKELGSKKKYFIVFTMIGIFGFILFYIFKRVSKKRAQYLKDLAKGDNAKHGESAIFEEQSAILEEKEEEKIDRDDMKIDLTQYFEYRKYDPQKLWENYLQQNQNSKPQKLKTDSIREESSAKIEIQIYYQTFVHLLRIHVLNLTNMVCFKTNDSKSLKLKVMLRKQSKECFSEITDTYPFGSDQNDDDGDLIEFTDKFSFPMKLNEVQEYFIYVSVWSVNVFYHEFLLGAAHVDLSCYSEYTEKTNIFADIVPVKKDKNIYGHLLLGLCYLPNVERLVCVVMCGKDLKDDVTNLSILDNVINPFVDVFLVNSGKMIEHQCTKILLDAQSPVFNEGIEFYIPSHQIEESDLYLIAMHKYNSITNTLIGKVMIGSHSDGLYKSHWEDTLRNPEKVIPMWHPITR